MKEWYFFALNVTLKKNRSLEPQIFRVDLKKSSFILLALWPFVFSFSLYLFSQR